MEKGRKYAKGLVSFLIILGYFLASQSWILPSLNYAVNNAYISKKLCDQRFVSQNICKGKCYLEKQIAKAEEEDRKTPQINFDFKLPLHFHESSPGDLINALPACLALRSSQLVPQWGPLPIVPPPRV